MMRNAKIINEDEVSGDQVNVGLKVRVKDKSNGEEQEFVIVGSTEADPFCNTGKDFKRVIGRSKPSGKTNRRSS